MISLLHVHAKLDRIIDLLNEDEDEEEEDDEVDR
jgi:hypothetical protein